MSLGGGRHGLNFNDVISIDNLLLAWKEFRKGKHKKADVLRFELTLEDNLFQLNHELAHQSWKPDPYVAFRINDPKPRVIHKASVRDRVLFQAVYRKLYKIFDPTFIFDSYSSRINGGTHKAVKRLEEFSRKVTLNHRKLGFALKCDIRKFFDSIDHSVLKSLIRRRITDGRLLSLIYKIIDSFETEFGKGLPLGNVTSQLFTNVYLNELDQFIKHELKVAYYIRYCDDFVLLSTDRKQLDVLLRYIVRDVRERLHLELHDRKVIFRKIKSGVDFLGYVVLPHRTVVRTRTKHRMFAQVSKQNLPSYLGLCSHAKTYRLQQFLLQKVGDV
ncbi:MAG: hypothetical protein A2664_04730 [Candidatus Taylorbacteria bacterium RIFCSPHIGHO2_01_FULL_46_22b]|uniref:Reverse transcriptase domain-containing protein n=1 Tax=Candidatus Taylorbacteria bacterium RIFCSPHIGHO2_01_FULL_46_22b TaxID=1802301 RepID=A0A1G2M4T8_9BACT|nr:MAG: hypothetical protein A2664_04730 [Candidatus Taylorbacteria bacterium RIFCSPHIGHO2_01_FULL_46_22b]